ncbi:MAG: PAS domain S-box protein [Nitrospirota bacterium]|nr:PAS domain S-box protein [Nitrospirota bacterium]
MSDMWTENLEQRRYLYDLFVENVQDFAIFLLDQGGHIITWNEGGHRVLGYTAGEIKGKHLSIFYTEEDRACGVVEKELCTAKEKGTASDDRWLVRKDGRRVWVSGVTIGLHDIETACYGKIIRDQTETRQKEERFQNVNDNLHEKIRELEKFEEVTVGRELKMIELKREMERLKARIKELEARRP